MSLLGEIAIKVVGSIKTALSVSIFANVGWFPFSSHLKLASVNTQF